MDAEQAKNQVKELVAKHGGKFSAKWDDKQIVEIFPFLNRAKVRSELAWEGIVISINIDEKTVEFKGFDLNKVNNEIRTAITKLKKLLVKGKGKFVLHWEDKKTEDIFSNCGRRQVQEELQIKYGIQQTSDHDKKTTTYTSCKSL